MKFTSSAKAAIGTALLSLALSSSVLAAEFGSAGKKPAVAPTINGEANVPFYKELSEGMIIAYLTVC